ncbi:MAG: hypothetical protein Q6370_009810 [Candidatus Sigynarchaeota archaeon]
MSLGVGTFVLALLVARYKQSKIQAIKHLRNMMLFVVMAVLIDFIVTTVHASMPGAQKPIDYIALGTHMSFTCNAISNIFLLFFIKVVFFNEGSKKGLDMLTTLAVIEASIGPLLIMFFFVKVAEGTLVILIVHAGAALTIYLIQAKNALKLRARIKGDEKRRFEAIGLVYISASGILLFMAIVMFILHEILLLVPFREYLTIMFGWLLGAVAAVAIYLGYTPPAWLRDRWMHG